MLIPNHAQKMTSFQSLPKKTKERAYLSLIIPVLEYACSVWDPYYSCPEGRNVPKESCQICEGKLLEIRQYDNNAGLFTMVLLP